MQNELVALTEMLSAVQCIRALTECYLDLGCFVDFNSQVEWYIVNFPISKPRSCLLLRCLSQSNASPQGANTAQNPAGSRYGLNFPMKLCFLTSAQTVLSQTPGRLFVKIYHSWGHCLWQSQHICAENLRSWRWRRFRNCYWKTVSVNSIWPIDWKSNILMFSCASELGCGSRSEHSMRPVMVRLLMLIWL